MASSTSSGPLSQEEQTANSPAGEAASAVSGPPTRIDFALLREDRLLVYGWILGFSYRVEKASLKFGNTVIDLSTRSTRVRRPDVAEHFSMATTNDEHGFYMLVEVPGDRPATEELQLTVVVQPGETHESRWPVKRYDPVADPVQKSYATSLRTLISNLPRDEARRLANFVSPEMEAELDAIESSTPPPPIRFEIDFCSVLEDRVLVVYGWIFDPANEFTSVQLAVGSAQFDFFAGLKSIPRPDITPDPLLYLRRGGSRLPGFIFVQMLPKTHDSGDAAKFSITTGNSGRLRLLRPVCWNVHDSRKELFSLLGRLDVESAFVLTEYIASALDPSPELKSLRTLLELSHDSAVQRLPSSIQNPNMKCLFHVDQTISVAGRGIFLSGWAFAKNESGMQVVSHCGEFSYSISENWIRHPRADVSSHLEKLGLHAGNGDHGFSCYVPIEDCDRPHYLAVKLDSGELHRVRLPVPETALSPLQTVRTLLGSIQGGHRELRAILDRQIGPAVQTVWASRGKRQRKEFVQRFGVTPDNPSVSVIVPLFGRCDFAEFQLALFADDPDFQNLELIYAVDDPAIFDAFLASCPGLHAVYRVPFTVAFPGTNLGFSAANNFAAEYARGPRLLLLNSDVFPKRRGWIGKLLGIYESIEQPGLLGCKLLFEDGSLQHAGIAFRRYLPWGGLWINDHPLKGQNPEGLTGTQEVDAVTAACALIDTGLYREMGGLSEDYIIGDFEDSDLCLRARMAGCRNYVALDVELYHLERQSQKSIGDTAWRTNLTIYNCWLHNKRWADFIERSSIEAFSVTANGGRG